MQFVRRQVWGWLAAAALHGVALAAEAPVSASANTAARTPGKAASQPTQPLKVLRYSFRIAETGFDPAKISDLYSRTITTHIFEAMYRYDPLARPLRVVPLTAAGMPEHTADYRVWTVKLQPGIYFADDPAFKGRKRELVAEDYVYALKRFADPAVKSATWGSMEDFEFLGLKQARQQALTSKQPFDYDTPIAGIRALDRYTVQFSLGRPDPRFLTSLLVASDIAGAVAREVAEFYGDTLPAHPVGTGPFKLAQWRRSSFIALDRNPDYRDMRYDAQPTADDTAGQAILARLKGRKLPMIDRVEISIIEENQPRWLSFLQGDADWLDDVPAEYIDRAMPAGKVAPDLAKRGFQGHRMVRSDAALVFFNMEDPVIGGYTAEKVALRRAISLGLDIEREILMVRHGQAIAAQSMIVPNTSGYDPAFRSEHSAYSPARAKALLDLYGYVDKDGDGWRDMPDGSPLLLRKATQPDLQSRQLDEQWRRDLNALNIRIEFITGKWPENQRAARGGKLQMWGVGSLASSPDGQGILGRLHSRQIGGGNMARFNLPEFDALYDRMSALPDGPEREALFLQAKRLAVAYVPYKVTVHRYVNDLVQPWVIGYRRPLFWKDLWQYVDIDESRRPVH